MEKGKRKMALGVESDHVELREGDKMALEAEPKTKKEAEPETSGAI